MGLVRYYSFVEVFMSRRVLWLVIVSVALFSPFRLSGLSAADDPLLSWNEGQSKRAIVAFVTKVTREGADFLPVPQRIAVVDNDGTLWSEQPMYVQLAFALDRVKLLADRHPEWRQTQPFKGVLEGDLASVAATGEKGVMEVIGATHAGMTADEFSEIVSAWLETARHPRFHRPYTECVYQPMLELMKYLRDNGFQTYIVSGGGVEFIRVFAGKTYGVPPQQVIGSTIKTKYEVRDGVPVIVRLPELNFLCDKAGKPVELQRIIGTRPVMAFGNSDGDFEMLEYTTSGSGPRFGLIVHHTDAERESAYDRLSFFGRLDRGLKEGPKRGWTIVSMKDDWKQIFPETGK